MGAWSMAKPIPIEEAIGNKAIVKVKTIEGIPIEIARSNIIEIRKSEDTGNIFVKFRSLREGTSGTYCGLLMTSDLAVSKSKLGVKAGKSIHEKMLEDAKARLNYLYSQVHLHPDDYWELVRRQEKAVEDLERIVAGERRWQKRKN